MWTETLVSLRTDTHLTPYTACSNGSGRTLLGTVARTLTKKNYIYICIFIYTVYIYPIKRFSVSLHLNARRECRPCPQQELSGRPLLGRFWGGSAQDSSSSSSPGSQTSLAGRLLGKQTSLRLLPLSWIGFFFHFFFFFFSPLFFAFLFFRN